MKKIRRKQRRKQNILLPTSLRWVGTALLGVCGAWVLFEIVAKAVYPYQLGDQQAKKVVALETQVKAQETRNQELTKEVTFLESDEGIEALARSVARYHRSNETIYLIPKPETE
jgi:cell division protein FtsB